jgi:hypothetical protein
MKLKIFDKIKGRIPYKLLFFLVLTTELVSMGTFTLVMFTPDRLLVVTQYLITVLSIQFGIAQLILGILLTYFYMKWRSQIPSEVKV